MQVQEIIIIIYIFMTLASLQLLLIYNFQICVPKKIQSCQRKKIVSARPHPLEDELTVKCCLLKNIKSHVIFITFFVRVPFWENSKMSRFTVWKYWLAITPTRFYYSNYSIQKRWPCQSGILWGYLIRTDFSLILVYPTYMVDVYVAILHLLQTQHIYNTHSHTKNPTRH